MPENHPNPLDQNAAEMSFGLLEMSYGLLEMSFGVLEMSFEDIDVVFLCFGNQLWLSMEKNALKTALLVTNRA